MRVEAVLRSSYRKRGQVVVANQKGTSRVYVRPITVDPAEPQATHRALQETWGEAVLCSWTKNQTRVGRCSKARTHLMGVRGGCPSHYFPSTQQSPRLHIGGSMTPQNLCCRTSEWKLRICETNGGFYYSVMHQSMLGPGVGVGGGRAREGELDKPDFPVSKSPPQGHLRVSTSPPPGTHCLSWHRALGRNMSNSPTPGHSSHV